MLRRPRSDRAPFHPTQHGRPLQLRSLFIRDAGPAGLGIDLLELLQLTVFQRHDNGGGKTAQAVESGQKGMMTRIPVAGINSGLHRLQIDKIYWVDKGKKAEIIKSWDCIRFSID